ncbi:hypothetical protein [Aquibaculum sediminis]|uniref:hypothetical protein n=1 Tax=Aquibaculum sediminis TaxID=3231907 RepID=UPI0034514C55
MRLTIRCAMIAAMLVLGTSVSVAEMQQPYAGLLERPIKALPEEQVEALLNGQGAGFALTAELNGYPGPLHVLELSEELELAPEQRRQIEGLYDEMKGIAIELGRYLVELESTLDREFASRSIGAARLDELTSEIGRITGELRATHLRYHLETDRILSRDQVEQYDMLRGYSHGDHYGEHRASEMHHGPSN